MKSIIIFFGLVSLLNAQSIQVEDLDEYFKGFERRLIPGNKVEVSYKFPPGGIYEYGISSMLGSSFKFDGDQLVQVSPIRRLVLTPPLAKIYSYAGKEISLGNMLVELQWEKLDSDQLYSVIVGWAQAVIVLDTRTIKLALSEDQSAKISREIGTPEINNLLEISREIKTEANTSTPKDVIKEALKEILRNLL